MTSFDSELILARLHGLHPKSSISRSSASSACSAPRQSRAAPGARGAHRGHQRQGLDARHARRHAPGRRAARAALHLPASGTFQRAHPARRRSDPRARADRRARRLRAGQRRRADHLRDHHGSRIPGVRPAPCGRRAAGDRARRPARRHQRHRAAPPHRALAHLRRSPGVPRRTPGADRFREGRHPEAGRALHRRPAAAGGACGDRGAGPGARRAAPCARPGMARAARAIGCWWPSAMPSGICRCRRLAGRHQIDNAGLAVACALCSETSPPTRKRSPRACARRSGPAACSA